MEKKEYSEHFYLVMLAVDLAESLGYRGLQVPLLLDRYEKAFKSGDMEKISSARLRTITGASKRVKRPRKPKP